MPNARAKQLRTNMTDAERKLWQKLRARQLEGAYFRRQCPIGRYIVDFVCHDARLIVELDGGQHNTPVISDRDRLRDRWLEGQGYTVLRFWNNDVMSNMDGVCQRILEHLRKAGSPPSYPPPIKGRGTTLRHRTKVFPSLDGVSPW